MGWICSWYGYYITRNVLTPPYHVDMFLNTIRSTGVSPNVRYVCSKPHGVTSRNTFTLVSPPSFFIALYLLQANEHSLQTVFSGVSF